MLLIALLLTQAAPAALVAAKPAPKVEPVCIRAGDPPAGFADWYKPAGQPMIGKPFMIKASGAGDDKGKTGTADESGKTGTADESGKTGTAELTIVKPGTYRVALNEGVWVDVDPKGGKALDSTAHGHGPACTGMRKIVDFKLAKGRYLIRLSRIKTATVKAMVVPVL